MLEKLPCNICNSDNFKVLVKTESFNIVQCGNCNLVYRNSPIPKQDYLNIYRHNYYTPLNRQSWYDRKIVFFKRAIKGIEKIKQKGRLLDLGCGYGHFLDLARKDGWQTFGVEISNYASKWAIQELKLNIFEGELKDAHFLDDYFDVITMWNFLDHLYDPLSLLREVNRILKKDGLVVMRILNMHFQLPGFIFFKKAGSIADMFKIRNQFVIHNYSFSKKTLKAILEKAGFNNIKVINSRLRNWPVAFINSCFFYFAQLLFYLSSGKIIIAPTQEAYARK